MSASLSKELRAKYHVRSIPIVKGDEVTVVRGDAKDTTGKVTSVFRKKYVVYINSVKREKANGTEVQIALHPSNLLVTKLNLKGDRERILARRVAGTADKGKIKESEVKA
eukprot:CAMPEP_0184643298 /NCGR_PEP_ID=MMETSP0308-20130426/116_1 /TAXON_ID=38269 /ORGANISM="Gloeochaete witrockiana, Strain SAG 46.84" /LENGTH=109 /DNA_ID=CAMNT_0027071123 /DNA_START=105 /DNA_END=434 /DNA_ORIENTATION=+